MSDWITEHDSGDTEMEHRDGVPHWEAPLPRRWHRCYTQTRGWINFFTWVRRCPCGAISINGGPWEDKNAHRRDPPLSGAVKEAMDRLTTLSTTYGDVVDDLNDLREEIDTLSTSPADQERLNQILATLDSVTLILEKVCHDRR